MQYNQCSAGASPDSGSGRFFMMCLLLSQVWPVWVLTFSVALYCCNPAPAKHLKFGPFESFLLPASVAGESCQNSAPTQKSAGGSLPVSEALQVFVQRQFLKLAQAGTPVGSQLSFPNSPFWRAPPKTFPGYLF